MPTKGRRRRDHLRQAAEEEADGLDEDDAETEGDEDLVFGRPCVEVPDDRPLHHHADQHDEQRARDHGDDERPRIAVGEPAGIAAQHEHRPVREVENAERAVNDRQAGRDQRKQRAEHQPVETLRNEIAPVDHDIACTWLRCLSIGPPSSCPALSRGSTPSCNRTRTKDTQGPGHGGEDGAPPVARRCRTKALPRTTGAREAFVSGRQV